MSPLRFGPLGRSTTRRGISEAKQQRAPVIEPAVRERTFDPVAASVHDAREFMSDIRGLPRSVKLDDIVLVVSELTSNAVIHAHTPFVLKVEVAADRVRVEVFDGNRQRPKVSDGALSAVGGRGLLIVDRLASTWGVVATPAGKIVFAEFRSLAL